MTNEVKNWAEKEFGINAADVIWYHGGICYSRIIVRTKSAANKVAKKVAGQTVNGGWFDGMPLGCITKQANGYEVTC